MNYVDYAYFKAKDVEKNIQSGMKLSIKGVEIPMEDMQKGIIISAVALLTVIVGFFMFYKLLPKNKNMVQSYNITRICRIRTTDEDARNLRNRQLSPSVIDEENLNWSRN